MQLVITQIIYNFLPQGVVTSDNASCFISKTLQDAMKKFGLLWKPVLAYVPLSNGKAERMVGTLRRVIARLMTSESLNWDQALPKAI